MIYGLIFVRVFAFVLGREYKLSIAELFSVFFDVKVVVFTKEVLVLDKISEEKILEVADKLGGTIKIIKLMESDILDFARKKEGKFSYGINVYGKKGKIKDILSSTKKKLKDNNVSSRYVNKDLQNLSTAQILGERLVKKGTDFNCLYLDNKTFFGVTIWVQDINAYSKRDYSKERDMKTGMLPPKLAQMMINLGGEGKSILDPFVGLGTVLIEASLIGYEYLYGSDLNEKMIKYSEENLKKFVKDNNLKIKELGFEKLNAKFINESKFLNSKIDLIVSEGYLGEIMTKKNISIERIDKQKDSLKDIYERFFLNIGKTDFNGVIVISFPFWEYNGKYIYFTEIYDIILKYCGIEDFFPDGYEDLKSKSGSLLYKRESQLVGREIFKLKMKANIN